MLIYELIFGSRIIYLNWYDSVYQWNEGRRFFYSAPRMAAGLIEPQNHLRLLEGFQQPVTQLPGFPPHPDFPWVQLSLLGTCRQIYEEAREIPFKKNIFVALSALPYAAFCNKIFLPLQTSSIKFLTIVINAGFHVGPNLRHWYDRRVQPLPTLWTRPDQTGGRLSLALFQYLLSMSTKFQTSSDSSPIPTVAQATKSLSMTVKSNS